MGIPLSDPLVIMSGINDKRILSRLLQEGDKLTFTKARELAIAIESAERNVEDLQADPPPPVTGSVHAVRPPPPVCH